MSTPAAGILCVPCEKLIPSLAVAAFTRLQLPTGSRRAFVVTLTTPAAKRNACIQQVLADPLQPAWIFFADSDILVAPDTVARLLETNLDVVGALYSGRVRSEAPLTNGNLEYGCECGRDDGTAFFPNEVVGRVVACDWVSAGALLVRRRVLEALAPGPWFEADATGENEDMEFCAKARAAGFAVHVDGRVRVAHLQMIPVTISE